MYINNNSTNNNITFNCFTNKTSTKSSSTYITYTSNTSTGTNITAPIFGNDVWNAADLEASSFTATFTSNNWWYDLKSPAERLGLDAPPDKPYSKRVKSKRRAFYT